MAKAKTPCAICGRPAKLKASAYRDYEQVKCGRCGEFQVSRSFLAAARHLSVDTKHHALQRAVTRAEYGAVPIVTTYDLP